MQMKPSQEIDLPIDHVSKKTDVKPSVVAFGASKDPESVYGKELDNRHNNDIDPSIKMQVKLSFSE